MDLKPRIMKMKIITNSELEQITTAKVCNPTDFFPWEENKLEPFWNNIYLLLVTHYGFSYIVNANCEQDALDYLIDYLEEEEHDALLMSTEEMIEAEEEGFLEEYPSGGNHGRYIYTHNLRIEQIHQDDIIAC